MIKNILFLALGVLQISAYSATAQDVRYNFDKETDFTQFKTYRWVQLKDAAKVDSLRDKSIKESVDAQLAQKGLTKTDAENADLLIGYQAGVGTEKQFTSYNTGWGYGGGWYQGGWYGPGGTTTGQTSTIYTGQLALDMYDSKHHDLVWRGLVSKTIDPEAKPEKQEKNLNKAVAKLLKNYPPSVKK